MLTNRPLRTTVVVVTLGCGAAAAACSSVLGLGSYHVVAFDAGGEPDGSLPDTSLDAERDADAGPDDVESLSPDGKQSDTPAASQADVALEGPANGGPDGAGEQGDSAPIDPDAMTAADAGSEGASPDAACAPAPLGWSAVLVGRDADASTCPAGFTPHDALGQLSIGSMACLCSCSVTRIANCTGGTLSPRMGTDMTCPQPWFSVAVAGAECTTISGRPIGTKPVSVQVASLPPQGGSCAGALHSDGSQTSAPAVRYCSANPRSQSVCDASVQYGFSACVMKPGMTPCPPGSPYGKRQVVAASSSLQCSACSACSVTSICSQPTLTVYSDDSCRTALDSFLGDDTCAPIGTPIDPATSVAAVTYRATAASTCVPGASTPTAQVASPVTICCR